MCLVVGFETCGSWLSPPRDCQTFGKSNIFMSKIVFPQVVRRKRRRIPVEVFS